jgi:hypothetical protein
VIEGTNQWARDRKTEECPQRLSGLNYGIIWKEGVMIDECERFSHKTGDFSCDVDVAPDEGYFVLFSTPEPEAFSEYVRKIW